MKKLSKLVINPEKVMTDGELVTLKGGLNTYYCTVTLSYGGEWLNRFPVEADCLDDAMDACSYVCPDPYVCDCR